ncbi:arf-GAP with SH3 domain, ANK repeat and PH domain-containing protein 1-like [Hipposideros larvatus]
MGRNSKRAGRRPDQISVSEFIAETTEDCRSPTTSSFTTRMQSCKNTITLLEEALDEDRAVLQKMKESVKAMYDSGQDHVENQIKYAELLNMFGSNILNKDNSDVGTALVKFSALTEDLSILKKTLLQGLNDNVILTLESLLEGDLKEMKGDLRQSFDEAWKDYETKFTEIEKDQEYTEIAGAETSKKMEQERHLFQLQMCEYLIKVNETKTKKSVDLLQNLIEYNRAQCRFFQDGLKMAHTLKQSIKKLAGDIVNIKQTQDEEKKQLTSLRDLIKSSLQVEQKEDSQCCQVGNSLHQQHGNKEYRVLKIDYLLKKSTGIRKVWQRRMCAVRRGTLIIPHAATNRQATTVDLLTCQVKPDTKDDRRFYVISQNRTYHLQAKDQQECAVWISAITKSKEEAQTMAFRREERENSLEDDTNALEDVQRISGDDMCCDSGSADRVTTIQPPPDVTTKPHCADLLQKKALPPKPQLGDVLAKSQGEGVPPEAQLPPDVTTRPRPVDLCLKGPTVDSIERQASEDSNDLTPVPPPQKSIRDSQCRQVGDSMDQLHDNKEHGSEKIDYLLKKSTGILKVWQRRMCVVRRGTLIVPHAITNRRVAALDLLTCQVKPDTKDDRRFYVISQNRTYHLQAKDQQECAVWISAITKNKEEAQTMAFRGEERENSLEDDTNAIEDVQQIPGDDMCCDSGSAGPTGPPSTLPLDTQTSSGSSTLSKKRPPPPPPGHKRTLSILPAHYLTGPQTKRRSLGATTIQPPPDVTTKPRCADLLQKNTLPPKTQLGDVLAKSQAEDVPPEAQLPRDVTTRPRPVDLCPKGPTGDSIEKQASEDSNDLTPVLPPQKSIRGRYMMPTVKAMYDCQADEDDELTFFAGELIHVTGMEEPGWWIGYIEGQRERKGVFPVSYVDVMRDNIQHN